MNGRTKLGMSLGAFAVAATVATLTWLSLPNASPIQAAAPPVTEGPAVGGPPTDKLTRLANESTNVISESQAELLASSESISEAYSRLPELMIPCLEEKGYAEVTMTQRNDGSWDSQYERAEGGLAAGVADPYLECYWENMDDIDRLWQQSPDVSAASIALGLEVLECVRAEVPDIEFSTGGTEALNAQMFELDQRTNVVSECIRSIAGDSTQIKFQTVPE